MSNIEWLRSYYRKCSQEQFDDTLDEIIAEASKSAIEKFVQYYINYEECPKEEKDCPSEDYECIKCVLEKFFEQM